MIWRALVIKEHVLVEIFVRWSGLSYRREAS
jgi:hypothetical protein